MHICTQTCDLRSTRTILALCGSHTSPPCSNTDSKPGSAPPSSLFLTTLCEVATVSLDCVPHHRLESRIRTLQASLPPGTCVVLGLTARPSAAKRSFWTKTTIFTAIPFLPRRSRRAQARTTTPLFTSMHTVLGLLTSGQAPLTIEVVRNVSQEYSGFLHRCVGLLEDDTKSRSAFVQKWGREAWNEERLTTSWEAGLVDAGLLESWVIVVSKPA